MHSELYIALFAGLGGMLGWGIADFFAKVAIDEMGYMSSLVWAHVFGTIALALVALGKIFFLNQQIAAPENLNSWGLLFLFGALQAIIYSLVYKGFGKGQIALLNPIFASFTGLTAILSIVIFGEAVKGSLPVALLVMFAGILLINIDMGALRKKRLNFAHLPGLKEIGAATFLAALWTIFWDRFIGGKDWVSYALFMYGFMTFTLFVIARIQRVNLSIKNISPKLWKVLILIGLCETVAYLAISLGYSITSSTSVVALVSGAFSLPTIILALVFLKEKISLSQGLGAAIIILGIMLMSFL